MTRFGLSQNHTSLAQEILKRHLGQLKSCQVWVFGSRATGRHRPYSDLDLLIESTPPLSDLQKDRLAEAFEESDLPYKVDLVRTDELVEAYKDQILLERQLFCRFD